MSGLSLLFLLSIVNMFFGSLMLFKVFKWIILRVTARSSVSLRCESSPVHLSWQAHMYLGLLIMCGFVLFDTQLIIEKAENGDKDYVWWGFYHSQLNIMQIHVTLTDVSRTHEDWTCLFVSEGTVWICSSTSSPSSGSWWSSSPWTIRYTTQHLFTSIRELVVSHEQKQTPYHISDIIVPYFLSS